jgi:phage-related protein
MRSILFYQSASGRCPVREFLDGLDGKQAQKVIWVLQLIRELPRPPTKFFKKLSGTDLWEVRADVSGNAFLLLGFMDGERLVVLTSAFQKKTQKTPKQEIQTALKRKRSYTNRKG